MFDFLVVNPLTNLIILFYQIFGQNLGLAIIFFTIFLRILMLPLTIRQIRLQRKMAELQPKLQELQAKRKDPKQVTAEEMALMKQTASSCLGGCIPFLIQIPILIGLSMVITRISGAASNADFNNILLPFLDQNGTEKFHTGFLGFDIAKRPSEVGMSNFLNFLPYGILIVLLVITQFIQSKLMYFFQKKRSKVNEKKQKKNKPNQKKLADKDLEKQQMQEEMQKMMQMQTTYFLPFIVGVGAFSFPAALGVYWFTSNLFAILQTLTQYRMMDLNMSLNDSLQSLVQFKKLTDLEEEYKHKKKSGKKKNKSKK